jgi:hypothetical protein
MKAIQTVLVANRGEIAVPGVPRPSHVVPISPPNIRLSNWRALYPRTRECLMTAARCSRG